jgi:CBS domain-containing protein
MQTLADVLSAKGRHVWSVSSGSTVFDALQVLADLDIGALVVMENGCPVGILSERDYTRKIALRHRTSRDTPVRLIMTADFAAALPDMTVERCMELMTLRRTRHVLVMEDSTLHGIVSIGDLVKAALEDQRFTITQLEHYIAS